MPLGATTSKPLSSGEGFCVIYGNTSHRVIHPSLSLTFALITPITPVSPPYRTEAPPPTQKAG